ncbi:UNVERIFIED_ORG: hypothetical protein Xoosp15_161 [Xanthomonas phage Xoo-sp15]
MSISQVKYLVTFLYKENKKLSVIVIDEEGMNEDEISLEAQINLQNEGHNLDWGQLEMVSCDIVK